MYVLYCAMPKQRVVLPMPSLPTTQRKLNGGHCNHSRVS